MRKFTKHASHYLPLIGIFTFGFLVFWQFSFDRYLQIGTVLATAFGYVIWGIVHHSLHKDLYLVVVIEYLAIATLGVAAAMAVIFSP